MLRHPKRHRTFSLTALPGLMLLHVATFSPAIAKDNDRLEAGKQGETLAGEAIVLRHPYSKGVRIVGHSPIGNRTGNVITTWAGHCAYVAGSGGMSPTGQVAKQSLGPTSGVAVIDVRDPHFPKVVRYLQDKGALDAGETMNAVVASDRAVLAASTYGGVSGINGPKEGWLDLYDISNCADPKLLSEVKWPEPTHTITVSPNGRRVYGTVLNPFTGAGGIQVMDISDMSKPRFVGKFAVTRPDGTNYEFAPHELSISPDERRLYVGVIASKGDDLNKGIKISPPNPVGLGPEAGGIYILDNSDLAEGRANPGMRLIGTSQHGGWHSAVRANIKGVPYLVGAGELVACPGSWPRISNIADEKNPVVVGQFRLQMNIKENCPPREGIESATGGVVGRPGTATSHFNDVDSPTDTHLGLFPFMYAGLRIADLRNPSDPVEIAYFKPGDACMSHVRYVAKTGHIWFACTESGFWVIALKPELRASIGMPKLRKKISR
ncbi:LVIVD repeat-containing protein [Sphingobium boeckii]|uniref:LVIVD repeat-containing protein n=1 Tax=Sphingobium boeckii TaxID=1082345 RepID=A0A7W9EHI4_9SPHN|nr:hypothetical protein [Sphingobium boeckii]MBB5687816.1 hypothetical protein [Sphingobium boeckii]